jgi:crotonobetainyl-CoA:carnitine CoA-transferase CaiB-like acyl-CoA transferase
MLGIPFKFAAMPASVRRAPPVLGQHTEEILQELGIDAAAISALRADKVI